MTSATLTRDAILGKDDRKLKRVDVPEWGGHVYIRVLTLAERIDLEARRDNASPGDVIANTVAFALCDDQGTRLFVSDEDIAAFKTKSNAVILRLTVEVQKLNALSKADVEAIAKNSDAAPSDASSSNSPNGLGERLASLSGV